MAKKSKMGKSTADIFASTTRPASTSSTAPKQTSGSSRGPGRPAVHDEEWTKVTVVLMNRQIVFLDRLSADIRAKTGKAVKRAEIIRAMVDAVEATKLDLSGAGSEEEISTHIRSSMDKKRPL